MVALVSYYFPLWIVSVSFKNKSRIINLLIIIEYFLVGNCLLGGGCGTGQCCSAFGACGVGVQYCGATGALYPGWTGLPYAGSDCRLLGCGAGYCCSPYG